MGQQLISHIIPKPIRALSYISGLSKHLKQPIWSSRVKIYVNLSFMLMSPLNLPLRQWIKYKSSIALHY